ncbi:MAG: hypothetical protein GDYSWBUE_000230 [Candidatus Fervidibacterota bacterium]
MSFERSFGCAQHMPNLKGDVEAVVRSKRNIAFDGAMEMLDFQDPKVEHAIVNHKFSDALVALRAYCMLDALKSGVLEAIEKTQGLKPPRLQTLGDFIELCESGLCKRYLRYTHPYAVWHANEGKLRRFKDVAIVDLAELQKWL